MQRKVNNVNFNFAVLFLLWGQGGKSCLSLDECAWNLSGCSMLGLPWMDGLVDSPYFGSHWLVGFYDGFIG